MTTGNSSALLGGSRPPTSIINGFSAGGASVASVRMPTVNGGSAKQILSGALTAATYKEVLAVTGAGAINFLSAYALDATSRTIGLRVVIDGVTAFDPTSNAITATATGMIAVGARAGADSPITGHVPFNVSLSVSVKSSLTETDMVAIDAIYVTY